MENKYLITVEEFKELARPTSRHIDEGEVLTFIRECEDIYIIPAIGLACYKEVQEEKDEDIILLDGGDLRTKTDG